MILILRYFYMKFKIDTSELNKLYNEVEKSQTKAINDVKTIINDETKQMVTTAKSLAPVDTGHLRRNIHSDKMIEAGNVISKEVTSGADYSIYVEFGTGQRGSATNENNNEKIFYSKDWKGQAAQPFFFPAGYKAEDNINKKVDSLKRGFKL